MEVILIRHGQSESNARLTTELDAKLTPLGESQAAAVADYLISKPILTNVANVEVYVSPFRRTLQTCLPLCERTGLRAHVYPEMCEYFSHTNEAYASFFGPDESALMAAYPFVRTEHLAARGREWWPQELEDPDAIYRRASRVRDAFYALYAHTDRQVVLFSHAEPIGRLIEAMLRTGPSPGWPPWTENAGICRLAVGDPTQPAELLVMNDTTHLQARGIVSPSYA